MSQITEQIFNRPSGSVRGFVVAFLDVKGKVLLSISWPTIKHNKADIP